MNKKRLIGYLFVTMSVGCIQAQEQKSSVPEYKLWYDCPAQVWTEALPLGNGRLGAMVYLSLIHIYKPSFRRFNC